MVIFFVAILVAILVSQNCEELRILGFVMQLDCRARRVALVGGLAAVAVAALLRKRKRAAATTAPSGGAKAVARRVALTLLRQHRIAEHASPPLRPRPPPPDRAEHGTRA